MIETVIVSVAEPARDDMSMKSQFEHEYSTCATSDFTKIELTPLQFSGKFNLLSFGFPKHASSPQEHSNDTLCADNEKNCFE